MKVLLINQCAGNKGDRMVLLFVLRELQRNGVSHVWVSADGPGLDEVSDYRMDMNVEFIPTSNALLNFGGSGVLRRAGNAYNKLVTLRNFRVMRKHLCSDGSRSPMRISCNRIFAEALRQCDIVMSTGGHHVTSLLVPEVMSPQFHDICVALASGKRLILWSQSIGPFEFRHPENKRLVQTALSQADCIFVRDRRSLEELEKIGVRGNIRQTHESVIGMNDIFDEYVPPSQRPKTIGVSVYHIMRKSPQLHSEYVRAFARLVDWGVEQGYRLRFFPMEVKGDNDDRMLIREILSLARHGNEDFLLDDDLEPSAHIREVTKCRLFIGHKTHSVVLALASGTPAVAIAYHPKTENFMKQYGLDNYCLPDSRFDGDALLRLAADALSNGDLLGRTTFDLSRRFGREVRADFQSMVAEYRTRTGGTGS